MFCRKERKDIKDLSDLELTSFMGVEETALGGWRAVWRELKKEGLDPYSDFADLQFGGTLDAVVYAVRDGKVDAGSVRSDALERMAAEGKIDIGDFRVLNQKKYGDFPFLCSTVLYPEWPFAKCKHTTTELAQDVGIALLQILPPESPAAMSAQCRGWTIPLNYQPVHECLKELRVGPYRDYGKVSLKNIFALYWQWILAAVFLLFIMSAFTIRISQFNRRLKQTGEKLEIELYERKQAKKALRESEEKYRLLAENMQDCIWMINTEFEFTYVNSAIQAMLGFTIEEWVGSALFDHCPPEEKPRIQTLIKNYLERGVFSEMQLFEMSLFRKDGTLINTEISVNAIVDNNGAFKGFQGCARDITGRKQAKIERVRLMSAIKQSSEIIVIADAQAKITFVNPAFEKITGYSREEAIGQNPRILQSGKHDEIFYQKFWETLTNGKTWTGHFINKKKDGSLYTEKASISPVYSTSGEIINYVAVKRDISEEIKLEEQLRQSQKMESVGLLAGGVAHDFNNTLTPILGYADMALMGLDKKDPLYMNFKEIRNSAKRAAALTHQLLAFSRKQVLALQVVNLNETITIFNKMLHRLIREDIELVTSLEPSLGNVKADEDKVQQALMNLAVNARDAMPDGGSLTIETANVYLDEEDVRADDSIQPGKYVMLSVTDNGHGMDAETLDHIFEPFFTTKERGKGTGLGLSTVYGLVKQHEGCIRVESEPGQGTSFKIYLPLTEKAETAAMEEKRDLKEASGTETVLVVEDDEMVRDLACTILRSQGYNVIEACDGHEALSKSRRKKGDIHLLLTDVIMPEMKGNELHKRLIKKRPDIKVLYMSGYTDNVIAHHGVLDPGINFLQKPFSLKGLLKKVRETLED
ncbi:MAG: PAS domain S-box protein [Gemmatimonadota bacterium]|nr:PAS domain S-box protein [Gemmatimonadota bacterium]